MEHFSYKEPLKVVTVQPGVWMVKMDLINVYKYLVGGNVKEGASSIQWEGKTQNKTPMKFYLNTRKHFYTVTGIKQWDRLPKMVVESPAGEIFSWTWSRETCSS